MNTEKCLANLCTIFHMRGYTRIEQPVQELVCKKTVTVCRAEYRNPRNNTTERVVALFLLPDQTFGKSAVLELYKAQPTDQALHLLFVGTALSFQSIALLQTLPLYFECLYYSDVQSKKYKHVYVPHYTLLSAAETAALEQRLGPRSGLPKMICKQDVMARIFDFRKHDVVRVSGKTTLYRVLVDSVDIQ